MGPFRLYVVRKWSTAGFVFRPCAVFSTIRATVSGLRIPWAAGDAEDEEGGDCLRFVWDANGSVVSNAAWAIVCGDEDDVEGGDDLDLECVTPNCLRKS